MFSFGGFDKWAGEKLYNNKGGIVSNIASKIKPNEVGAIGGVKRPIEDSGEGPGSKKPAADIFTTSQIMEASVVHAVADPSVIPEVPAAAGAPAVTGVTESISVPDKMGCKIQMAQDSQGMPERQCTLTGSPQAIFLNVPGQKVGLIIGKNGETIKSLQEQSGAKIVIIQDGPEAALEKPLRITGAQENVEIAKQLVAEILSQDHGDQGAMGGFANRGRGRGRGRGGFPMRGSRGGGRGGFGANQWGPPSEYGGQQQHTTTDYLAIPTNKHQVHIVKSTKMLLPMHVKKNFVIRGTPDAVERAKQMIMEKVGMNGSNGGYSNGYGQSGGAGGWGAPSSTASQYHAGGYQDQPSSGGAVSSTANQPDYSSQWAEYYRSIGCIREAVAIEKHIGTNNRVSNGMPASPAVAPAANGAPVPGGNADYSAEWAEYYRVLGKVKEAEAIEMQMKNKAVVAGGAAPAPLVVRRILPNMPAIMEQWEVNKLQLPLPCMQRQLDILLIHHTVVHSMARSLNSFVFRNTGALPRERGSGLPNVVHLQYQFKVLHTYLPQVKK
ncbi:FUBP [Lepeophtheirus salmonis]|uniref:FUBP n=1 Tax=Lepeophtheirus salmonis TaxID=72036 RepID=A0A7R8D6B1_LEPSM|nr:FUBP [Lepeophtheirus salmonis]CAF3041911.1 FUBP [Lepeophtheirus salmonis]